VKPIACMITDRRRLPDATPEALLRRIENAAAGGVQLIQIRERDLGGLALFELSRRAVDAVRGSNARVIINDRVDVALAARAHGVHLRGQSFTASRVRPFVPAGFLIGQSVHSVDEAASPAMQAADYLLFGNVFETASKPGRPAAGLRQLADVVRVANLPVLAVGGISADRVPEILQAGAAGYAAITMFAEVSA
jgi:thiamine-phosphate diphosphorylase